MITILKSPAPVNLSGNAIPLHCQSNNMYQVAGNKSKLLMTFTLGQPVANNATLTLAWGSKEITITFKSGAYNSQNFQWPATNAITSNWISMFRNYLQRIYLINSDFDIGTYSNIIELNSVEKGSDFTISPTTTIAGGSLSFTTTAGVTPVIRPGFKLHCIAKNSGVTLGHEAIVPDSAGKANFDMGAYLNVHLDNLRSSFIGFHYPAQTAKLFKHATHAAAFNLTYAEEYDGYIRPANTTADFIALMGGLSPQKEKEFENFNQTFYSEFIQKGKFLTMQPRTKTTGQNSPERLYYFNVAAGTITLNAQKFYEDGTSQVVTLGSIAATANTVYEIDCGHGNFGQGTLRIESYDIYIANAGGTLISEKVNFKVNFKYADNEQHFLFRNSLGGFDTLRCTGRLTRGLEVDRETFEDSDRQRANYRNTAEIPYTANTGSITAEMFTWLDDMLLSGEVYWLNYFRAIPIVLTGSKKTPVDDDQRRFSLTFEFELANLTEYYSVPSSQSPSTPNNHTDA